MSVNPSYIAIIDDHASIAKSMALALGAELPRFTILNSSDIANVSMWLAEKQPSIGIVDWRLGTPRPNVPETGSDVIRQSTAVSPHTKWILFTAHPTPFVLKDAIAAGISGCVAKTAEYTELLRAILTVMDGRKYFCPESQQALANLAIDLDVSQTEREILRAIAEGLEPKEIADRTGLAVKTVYNSLNALRQKLGVSSMVALANFAVDHGIAPPPP